MEQVLSIYLPLWDIQLHTRPSPKPHDAPRGAPAESRGMLPLLLIRSTARLETVARCCAIARALGVTPGMSLADARAACGQEVAVTPFDPAQSLHALHRLARWMARFSPTVALDPTARDPGELPDGLLLDMTGAAHLFGGEHLLLTEIATRLARMGFSSRLAIAPTIGTAWALARFAPDALTVCHAPRLLIENQKSKIENPLALLPIPALRLPAEIVAQLHSVGIERIGQLRALPRESLLHRFGAEVLLRLDQALGCVAELLVPLRVHEPVSVTRPYDGPTLSLEGIFLTLRDMLTELTGLLWRREAGIRGLRLHWIRFNAPPLARDLVTAAATRDAKHLWNLLRPKVEAMQMGYGVEAMTLTAFWIQTMPHRQEGIWEHGDDSDDCGFGEFLDTVVNRWGSDKVLAAAPAASHVPEEAWGFGPAVEENEKRPTPNAKNSPLPFLDRPTCLLDPPESAEVLALQPDLPPSRIFWRGEWRAVLGGSGPERIMTPWWRVPPEPVRSAARDYYKVETLAGWLWLFRDAQGKWFIHGVWS